jgi:hypothetical protein
MNTRADRINRLSWVDVFVLCFGPVLMACDLILNSSRTFFWYDEALTLVMVKGLSFGQMIDTLNDTINAFPPAYFCLIWVWAKVFGTSIIALRAFSTVFLAAIWVLSWFMVRSFSSRLSAFVALIITVHAPEVRFMNTDARGYSLYCFAYLAAGYCLMLSLRQGCRPSVIRSVVTFLAFALLVTTHYIGIIYAGAVLSAAIGIWWVSRSRALWWYCLAGIAGASLTLVDVPFYLAQRTLGGESNWLTKPGPDLLYRIFTIDSVLGKTWLWLIAGIVCVNIFVMGLLKLANRGVAAAVPERDSEDSLTRTFPAASLLIVSVLIPPMIWVESRFGLRLFLHRYLLPTCIVMWPIIIAFVFERALMFTRRNAAAATGNAATVLWVTPWVVAMAVVLVGSGKWVRPKRPDALHEMAKSVAKITESRPLTFVSHTMLATAYRSYCHDHPEHVKFLDVPVREKIVVNVIARRLDDRFWKDYVIGPGDLASDKRLWLMRAIEAEDCQNILASTLDFKILERLENDLVVVSVQKK